MKRALLVVVAAVLGTGLASCSQPGDGGYRLTAYFPRAVALYSQSRVKLMGVDVGRVTDVRIDGDRIRVDLAIDKHVPLPADVHAMIIPLTLIGERNIVLHPAWHPGTATARNGDVIPEARTEIPVEPDEALKALTNLARAIDPTQVHRLITNGAAAVAGQGETFNAALDQAATLTSSLASQDESLLAIVDNIHQLADTFNQHQQQLAKLIDDFSTATGVLAEERDAIRAFLTALAQLIGTGDALLTKYQEQLPGDVATLTQFVLTVDVNAGSVTELLRSLNGVSRTLISAWNPTMHTVTIRLDASPAGAASLEALLNPLLKLLGLPPVPTCVPGVGGSCG